MFSVHPDSRPSFPKKRRVKEAKPAHAMQLTILYSIFDLVMERSKFGVFSRFGYGSRFHCNYNIMYTLSLCILKSVCPLIPQRVAVYIVYLGWYAIHHFPSLLSCWKMHRHILTDASVGWGSPLHLDCVASFVHLCLS